MRDMQAAVIQMVSGSEPDANLAATARLLAEAARAGAQLAVLPENFAVFNAKDLLDRAERPGDENAPLQRFLAQQARELGLWLVGGSIPLRADTDDGDPRVYSSCLVYAPDGTRQARYDKIHLFDVDVADAQGRYRESERFRPGNNVVTVDTPFGRLGLAICYDLRFPELFRELVAVRGAEILVLPSAFTYVTGQAHWETLLRARAVENSCFMLASGQGGRHDAKRETWGHSMILDPWGERLALHETGEGFALATLRAERLAEIRARLPALQHRRLNLPAGNAT